MLLQVLVQFSSLLVSKLQEHRVSGFPCHPLILLAGVQHSVCPTDIWWVLPAAPVLRQVSGQKLSCLPGLQLGRETNSGALSRAVRAGVRLRALSEQGTLPASPSSFPTVFSVPSSVDGGQRGKALKQTSNYQELLYIESISLHLVGPLLAVLFY